MKKLEEIKLMVLERTNKKLEWTNKRLEDANKKLEKTKNEN